MILVTRRPRLRGQDHRPVILRERLQFGIQLRVEPVGVQDSRLEIVDDHGPRRAAKMPKGVFQNAKEVLGRLAEARFAVGFS